MIRSVPRSGTRMLADLLGLPYSHFGDGMELDGNFLVPLRDPLAVLLSWARDSGNWTPSHDWKPRFEEMLTREGDVHIPIERMPYREGYLPRQNRFKDAYVRRDLEALSFLPIDELRRLPNLELYMEHSYDLWWA